MPKSTTPPFRMNLSRLANCLLSLALLGLALPGASLSARAGTLGDGLDAPQLTWTSGGTAPWLFQTATNHDGVDAAQSGALNAAYQESWLETTVTGQVAVAFWWKVSTDPNWPLDLRVNGGSRLSLQGQQDWLPGAINLTIGTNTLRWVYRNPATDPADWNANAAWLDQVVVTNIAGLKPAVIFQPPASLRVPDNYPVYVRIDAAVVGELPLAYQWQRSGTNLDQKTSPTFYLWQAQPKDAGDYQLVVTNAFGSVTTAVAHLEVVPSAPLDPHYAPNDAELCPGVGYQFWSSFYGTFPLTYQWEKNGVPQPGATNGYYRIDHASATDTAGYRVIASNAQGSVTSRVAQITVTNRAPNFLDEPYPESQTVAVGDWAYLYANAAGAQPVFFNWERDGQPVDASGGNYLSFEITDPTNSGLYRVIAENCGGAITSRVSVLAVPPVHVLGVALDARWLSFTNDPWNEWRVDVTGATAHDGVCAARSPEIGDYNSATFATSISGPTNVAFWWRISAGEQAFLEVSVDGSVSNLISGEVPWQPQSLALPAGQHTLAWTFRKDDAGSVGEDAAWVDQLSLGPLDSGSGELTNFTTGGDALWFSQAVNTHDGVDAWQSGLLDDDEASWLETTVTGPGTLTFWWAVESEECCDRLEFSVDGLPPVNIAGLAAWLQESVELTAGSHTLRWLYSKDGSVAVPRDAGWVDDVRFTPTLPSAYEITNFTSAGDASWFTQSINTHDSVEAWQSGLLEDYEESWLEAVVTGPGRVTFWWAVESEECCDPLEFSVDGLPPISIAGLAAWQQESVELTAGSHVLRWRYSKDGSVAEPRDAGWVDEVFFTPGPTPPQFTLEQSLNVTNLTFSTGGDAPWFVQATNSHDGVMAAQSGPLGDSQSSWLRTTVTGPGTLTYWYAISTEIDSDNLHLPWLGYTSGGAPYLWTQETLELPAGTHTLEWRYEKDGSGSDGSDAAWLDQLVWTRLETPLVTVGSQWKYPGETCAFTGAVTGLGPFTFQWYRAGAPIAGATSETLTPFTATYANAGTYSLVAVNSIGATTNDAQLIVAPVFYELTDLGSLWPGDFTMHPNGVNTRGDVVGNCSTNANALGHAWVWSGGVLTDLGDALGGGDAQAYAINDEGDIVGTARVPGTTNYNAIRWRRVGAGYVVDDLGRNGWPYAFATAINNAGDIAFSMTDGGKSGNGNRRAFLWRNGTLLPLGTLAPAWPADIGDAFGWGMNSVGCLVGTANSAPPAPGENPFKRGWRFNGAWRENVHETYRLAALPDVPWAIDASGVYGVNDYGDLGGQYIHANWGDTGCFVTSGTNLLKLSDPWSSFHGLNNHGDALLVSDSRLRLVCSTNLARPARHPDGRPDYAGHQAFAVEDLVMNGLGDFASLGASGWTYHQLSEARAIVGRGVTHSGTWHGFLARPLPRPGNRPPVQSSPLLVTNFANTLLLPIAQLLATCTDADGDTLALAAVDGRSADGATLRRSGNYLQYTTPAGYYTCLDSFSATVLDFHGGAVTVTVLVCNRPSDFRPPFQGLALVHSPVTPPYLRFFAHPGETWRLEVSDTVASDSWQTLAAFIVGPDWTVDFTEMALLGSPKRFYRAVSP